MVDYGCGDWQFSRLIDWQQAEYVGVDVVPSLIAANQAAYGRDGVSFVLFEGDVDELPAGDLLVVKDVLQHLATAQVQFFLTEVAPRYRRVLVTNDFAEDANREIEPGEWRPLDLLASPFHANGTVVAVFRGAKVRTGRLRRHVLPASEKHTVLLEH